MHGLCVRLVSGDRRINIRRRLVASGVESDAESLGGQHAERVLDAV